MFKKSIKLFNLLGFEVKIDLSWIILAALITWSLSTGYFPFEYKNLSIPTYWFMGLTGALALFLSIIAHELSHSIVAKKYGIPMKGITLFIFGGVAEMSEEPVSPKAEFVMAIVGPISSLAIALILYVIYRISEGIIPIPVLGVIHYLAWINGILAVFNMLPAFPLDGGRVLRSFLWHWKNNLQTATRITTKIGAGFGIILIILGVFNIFSSNFIGGMWWVLIGMFLYSAATMSYRQLLVQKALEGEPVDRFMKTDPITVSPSISLEELVSDYVYQHHYKMFPVVENDKLIGCVTTRHIKEVSRENWTQTKVGDITEQCGVDNTIPPGTDTVKALKTLHQTGSSRLMVVEGKDKLVGIISLKDIMNWLSFKMNLKE
ncbi:MAG: site-2 protease family protein [Desulfobacterales bacterium]